MIFSICANWRLKRCRGFPIYQLHLTRLIRSHSLVRGLFWWARKAHMRQELGHRCSSYTSLLNSTTHPGIQLQHSEVGCLVFFSFKKKKSRHPASPYKKVQASVMKNNIGIELHSIKKRKRSRHPTLMCLSSQHQSMIIRLFHCWIV